MLPATLSQIQLAPRFIKDFAHLRHALVGFIGRDEARAVLILQLRELAHFLADLHRTEFRAAHAAEMRGLGAFGGERLVVVLLRGVGVERQVELRSEEHTSELQSLMRISYAVFCLKKKKRNNE